MHVAFIEVLQNFLDQVFGVEFNNNVHLSWWPHRQGDGYKLQVIYFAAAFLWGLGSVGSGEAAR